MSRYYHREDDYEGDDYESEPDAQESHDSSSFMRAGAATQYDRSALTIRGPITHGPHLPTGYVHAVPHTPPEYDGEYFDGNTIWIASGEPNPIEDFYHDPQRHQDEVVWTSAEWEHLQRTRRWRHDTAVSSVEGGYRRNDEGRTVSAGNLHAEEDIDNACIDRYDFAYPHGRPPSPSSHESTDDEEESSGNEYAEPAYEEGYHDDGGESRQQRGYEHGW